MKSDNLILKLQAEYLKRRARELHSTANIKKIIKEFLKDSIEFTFGDAIDAIYGR